MLVGIKLMFKNQDFQMFGLILNKYEQFSPTSSRGCGSDTQLQVADNLNKIT